MSKPPVVNNTPPIPSDAPPEVDNGLEFLDDIDGIEPEVTPTAPPEHMEYAAYVDADDESAPAPEITKATKKASPKLKKGHPWNETLFRMGTLEEQAKRAEASAKRTDGRIQHELDPRYLVACGKISDVVWERCANEDTIKVTSGTLTAARIAEIKRLSRAIVPVTPWAYGWDGQRVYVLLRFTKALTEDHRERVSKRFSHATFANVLHLSPGSRITGNEGCDYIDVDALLSAPPKDGEAAGKTLPAFTAWLRKDRGTDYKFNVFADRFEMRGKPIDKHLFLKEREELETASNCVGLKKELAKDAIELVAYENKYDPVVEWLDGLKWDYKDRLTGFCTHYMDAPDGNDTYIKRWLISAVARQYKPGCQADLMLLFRGWQGKGKDRFLRSLLPQDEWFCATAPTPGTNGTAPGILLAGHVIANYGELNRFVKSDMAAIKDFLTQTKDEFKRPYDTHATSLPRRCVFTGSTNAETPLRDLTGDRRFCIIDITEKIDAENIRADRDQIWAQAVTLYHRGEQWHLTDEEVAAQTAHNEEYTTVDPVLEVCARWGMTRWQNPFQISDALKEAGIELKDHARYANSLGSHLRTLGFLPASVRVKGLKARFWVHPKAERVVPPDRGESGLDDVIRQINQ